MCKEVDEAICQGGDTRSRLDEVLEYVASRPEHRDEFVECFRELVLGEREPWEVVYWCMRRLKWPEVYEMARADLEGSNDRRAWNILHDILDAYSEGPDDEPRI